MALFENIDAVISIAISFAIGMAAVFITFRIGNMLRKRDENKAIVEALVSEYTRRLKEYEKTITDMRIRLDILESRTALSINMPHIEETQPSQVKLQSGQELISQKDTPANHTDRVIDTVTVTEHHAGTEEPFSHNGTNDYILKLIAERPRTSREIQHAIGRTREHTSRLMRKLYESNLVSRDTGSKPFRYSITQGGLAQLKARSDTGASASELKKAA